MARRQRYPELALVARLIAASGYFMITLGVVGGATGVFVASKDRDWMLLLQSLGLGLGALFYGILVIAASQLIRLLIDIERNTRGEEISPVARAIAEVRRGDD